MDRFFHFVSYVSVNPVQPLSVRQPIYQHGMFTGSDRASRNPFIHFGLRPQAFVNVPVGPHVASPPIGLALDEPRSFSLPGTFDGMGNGLVHFNDVVSVNDCRMDSICRKDFS